MTQTREQLLAARDAIDAQIKALDAEPLLIEAREICARVCDGWVDIPSERSHAYRDGRHDDEADVAYALAALRRGMELGRVPAEPVGFDVPAFARECVADWYAQDGYDRIAKQYRQGEHDPNDDQDLRIADFAIRATLAHRGARWPGGTALVEMAQDCVRNHVSRRHEAIEDYGQAIALEMARRLKAHMTGEQP